MKSRTSNWLPGPGLSHVMSLILLCAGMLFLASLSSRDNFTLLAAGFITASAGWFISLLISWNKKQLQAAVGIAVLLRLAWLFAAPYLSDDWARFLWDGTLSGMGQNPYLQLPSAIADTDSELYDRLNSKEYYTVYPPLLQFVFFAAVKVGGSMAEGILFLRLCILLCELGSIWLIYKLLPAARKGFTVVYALCPLVITEFMDGIHFEAMMLFFILLAAYSWQKQQVWKGAILFAGAIGAKLIPIVLLPLFPFFLGWKKGLLAGILSVGVAVLTFLPFGLVDSWTAMSSSMRLYYQNFEFNGSLYYIARGIYTSYYGYNQISILGPALAAFSGLLILIIALVRRPKTVEAFLATAMLCLAVYQLFATTIHPWYIAPLVGLAAFGRYRFVLVWSVMIFFTYAAYQGGGFKEPTGLIVAEYALTLGLLRLEFIRATPLGRKVLAWSAMRRARIKFDRLSDWLNTPRPEKILDIGTGNGGFERMLVQDGHDVTGVDVKRKTCFKDIQPVIYDGEILPFDDNSFDCILILTVLHHTTNAEAIIREAMRAGSGRMIIMEDVYSSNLQKQLTFQLDGLVNDEWIEHPHSNKTEAEWETLFHQLGLQISKKRSDKVFGYF